MSRALLIGTAPAVSLGYTYVQDAPYDAVVIGSLQLSELLCFRQEQVLQALAAGKTVVLYTPGLPEAPKNRALAAGLASKRRELKNWGVLFTDGAHKRLVTAQDARMMRQNGQRPGADAVLTPLAKEILDATADGGIV